jgi:hypothetical protein
MVTSDPPPARTIVLATPVSGHIEIVIGASSRVIVDAGVNMAALSRVVDLLERR